MSTGRQDGGAAFPIAMLANQAYQFQEGMSLRDHFAGLAMNGAVAGIAAHQGPLSYTELSLLSYEIADAMLKARSL